MTSAPGRRPLTVPVESTLYTADKKWVMNQVQGRRANPVLAQTGHQKEDAVPAMSADRHQFSDCHHCHGRR